MESVTINMHAYGTLTQAAVGMKPFDDPAYGRDMLLWLVMLFCLENDA